MPTIRKGAEPVTFINVITVEPDRQPALIALLGDAAQQTFRHLPGFVSASIHQSMDGRTVVMYAQWSSLDDFHAMQRNPEAQAHIAKVSALGRFSGSVCEVAETVEAALEAGA
jgi:quinol monooxygenase YgiN